MDELSVRREIRRFIEKRLKDYGTTVAFSDQQSLVHSGLLDSLAVVYLIMFMEKQFKVDFIDVDFDPNEFDNVDAMTQLVLQLIEQQSP